MANPSLPCWYAVNKIYIQINSNSTIWPTLGPMPGVQQSLKE